MVRFIIQKIKLTDMDISRAMEGISKAMDSKRVEEATLILALEAF